MTPKTYAPSMTLSTHICALCVQITSVFQSLCWYKSLEKNWAGGGGGGGGGGFLSGVMDIPKDHV